MTRLLIVDGNNLLFQMFFGMPSRIVNSHGKAIQGVLGFVGALQKMIRRLSPSHTVVLFDGEHANGRTELDAAYKANREDYSAVEEDENPFSQLPCVYAALDHLGIRHAETTACEADDWIAGYALGTREADAIVIASFDSDFFQLIDARVAVFRYRGDKSMLLTPASIREKFGIDPAQYADWKALVGDTADNIKGARGIGPKTASALLARYGSLEAILAAKGTIPKPALRASLAESEQKLRINYQLIKLTSSHPLPFPLDELKYTDEGLSTGEILRAIGVL